MFSVLKSVRATNGTAKTTPEVSKGGCVVKGSYVKGFEYAFYVTVIVPRDEIARVTDAILSIDPLKYGNDYDQVTFESAVGIERFRPLSGSNPTAGSVGQRSSIDSVALSFTLPSGSARETRRMHDVIMAIANAHPWEEPEIIIQEVLVTRCR